MLNLTMLEQGIRQWLALGSGLEQNKIHRQGDKIPQLQQPYIRYRIRPPKRVGGPDEERWSDASPSVPGAELVLTTAGQREVHVYVQCFTQAQDGDTDIDSNYPARQYLSQCQTILGLPKVRSSLADVGLVYVDVQSFEDFSQSDGPVGAGRAVLDVRFRVVDSATDTETIIQNVNPTGTFTS